jgi:CD2 antigen cytoplasmic tail-binding protein 2
MNEKRLKQFALTKSDTKFHPHRPGFVQHEAAEVDEFGEDIGISKRRSKRRRIRTTNQGPGALSVNLNGVEIKTDYGGESSDDGEFNSPSKSANEDGMLNKERELNAFGKLKPKEVRFVNANTFNGQEYEDEEEDVQDKEEFLPSTPPPSFAEEIIDEEVGYSRICPPQIVAFNLREEEEEGAFLEDGSYFRKAADPLTHQDAWLDGMTKGQTERAREARDKQQLLLNEKLNKEEAKESATVEQLLDRVLPLLKNDETPLQALARLNTGKRRKWQPSQKWKKSKMIIDQQGDANESEQAQVKEQIETITVFADTLLTLGQRNVYDTPREVLIRRYGNDAIVKDRDGEDFEFQEPLRLN